MSTDGQFDGLRDRFSGRVLNGEGVGTEYITTTRIKTKNLQNKVKRKYKGNKTRGDPPQRSSKASPGARGGGDTRLVWALAKFLPSVIFRCASGRAVPSAPFTP